MRSALAGMPGSVIRTCVGCGMRAAKSDLLRGVAGGVGSAAAPPGRSAGNGYPPYFRFWAARRCAKVISTGSSCVRATPSTSQQASKSAGRALTVTIEAGGTAAVCPS